MRSRWNEEEAARLGEDLLAQRVYSSRLLGSDPALVLHGGGNTSVEATVDDLFGDPVEVLWVKGSGWDLATIEKAGFAPVRLDVLKRMAELESLSDAEMVRHQRAAMLDPSAPNPSVEAILHAIIPFRFVDHSHADAIVTITNTPSGAERIADLFGPRMLVVPYTMPGFVLAREVFLRAADRDWNELDGIVLLNHGLFTFGEDARTSYERHIECVDRAETYLDDRAGTAVPVQVERESEEHRFDLRELAELRRDVSRLRGQAVLANPRPHRFADREDLADVSGRGLLTPDHVIRTKRLPLVVGEGALEAYARDYEAYFARNDDGSLTRLDPAPRWALWPGRGSVAFGRTPKENGIIHDITAHTMAAIERAERLERWEVLGERDIFDVEYWELEQAKLKKGGAPAELTGKVALVTGAASGIGAACVEALRARGAVVAALDIEAMAFHDPGVLEIVCDVTDEEAVAAAIATTVRSFGGIDALISNAGTFPPSAPIESIEPEAWARSLELNLTSHQRLLRLATPYLKLGIEPAVAIVASKNVPAPGPKAAAYSAAKAGLTQLARVAALELGPAGIRVNVLHPNAVFDTAIWTPEVLEQRAASYGLDVEAYRRNNVLGVEVRSADVAALACALVGPLFSRTTGAQLPVDGGNERVI